MTMVNTELERHLTAFKEQGYTVFENVYDELTMDSWKKKYHQLLEDAYAKEDRTWWFANTCELAPKLMLPAAANPLILDFAEKVIGPFVQLDNMTLAGFPSVSAEEAAGKVSGWHRDRWARMPEGADYYSPLSINAICYLQDLTNEYGPLRVIPGSHRQRAIIAEEDLLKPHPEEVIIPMKAGNVVVTHNGLLHSGTPNTSGKLRYFFSVYYNKTWLKHTDNHSGPNVQRIVKEARDRNDHRIMRLFGVDDHLPIRCNSGFTVPDEERWAKWAAEDRAKVNR